jgi:hypothetical protein
MLELDEANELYGVTVGRVDLVWRMTHLDPGVSPLGIRAKLVFNF